MLLTFCQQTEKERIHSNLFCYANIILLQKVDKDSTRKWKATVLYEQTDRKLTQSSGYTNSVIHEEDHLALSIGTIP